jgi:hypothetical protein
MQKLKRLIEEYIQMYHAESTIIEKQQAHLEHLEEKNSQLEDMMASQETRFSRFMGIIQKITSKANPRSDKSQARRSHYFGNGMKKRRDFSEYYNKQQDSMSTYPWLLTLQIPEYEQIEYEVNNKGEKSEISNKTLLETVEYMVTMQQNLNEILSNDKGGPFDTISSKDSRFIVNGQGYEPTQTIGPLISGYKPQGKYIRVNIKISRTEGR